MHQQPSDHGRTLTFWGLLAEMRWSLKKVLVFVGMDAEKSQFFNILSLICASHPQFDIWVPFLMATSLNRGKAFEVTELVAHR